MWGKQTQGIIIVLFDTLVINMILELQSHSSQNHIYHKYQTLFYDIWCVVTFLSMLVLASVRKSGTLQTVCHKSYYLCDIHFCTYKKYGMP